MSKRTRATAAPAIDRDRLEEILKFMAGKRVLVLGDVGLDRYTIGSVDRISPEAPVPIVLVQEEKLKLGLAANVADNVLALGGEPLLLGVIGEDRAGQDFKKLLKDSGIRGTYLVTDASRRTVLKERVVSDRQQLLRVDYETQKGIEKSVEASLLENVERLLPRIDAVILEDYAKGVVTRGLARGLFALCAREGKKVFVDPNSKTPAEFYSGATVLTPNTKEAEALSGTPIIDLRTLKKAGSTILEKTRAQHVVITRGKEGMAVFTSGQTDHHQIPTYAREVYDVSGAGDTVISVLALGAAAGATLEESAVLGNLAAGVEVGKRGTATVSPAEIRSAMEFFLSRR